MADPNTAAVALMTKQVTMMGWRIRLAGAGRREPIRVPSRVAANRQGKVMYMAQPGLTDARPTAAAAMTPALEKNKQLGCRKTGLNHALAFFGSCPAAQYFLFLALSNSLL